MAMKLISECLTDFKVRLLRMQGKLVVTISHVLQQIQFSKNILCWQCIINIRSIFFALNSQGLISVFINSQYCLDSIYFRLKVR